MLKSLSKREMEVLTLLFEGHKYYQAAQKLRLSVETIRSHAYHSYRKLGVRNKAQALLKLHFEKELNL